MDSDFLVYIIEIYGVNMKFFIKFMVSCWVGISIWFLAGTSLEYFEAWNGYFMITGFWIYPIFDYINKTIMEYE